MNRYGRIAQKHWQETAPERYAAIPDPQEFFSTLGQQVESRIQELETAIAGPDLAGEGYLEKLGRLNMARKQAEEVALAELVWLEPGEEEDLEDEEPGLSLLDDVRQAIRDADRDG